MALIRCPECGKEISEKAVSCPKCGCPISDKEEQKEFKAKCLKCGGTNIVYSREQSGNIGRGTNRYRVENVKIKPKKSKGCLYWMIIGFWAEPLYWLFIGWWYKLFVEGKRKTKINMQYSNINKTIAICQDCGNTWRV